MNTMENTISPTDNHASSDERKKSPPAFLDLADSVSHHSSGWHSTLTRLFKAARLGSNMPDMSAVGDFFFTSLLFSPTNKSDQRVELKRLEHERQRLLQRKLFEDQMRALEQKQAQELLSIPSFEQNGNGGVQHLAVSAPTTPPRVNTQLGEALRHYFVNVC